MRFIVFPLALVRLQLRRLISRRRRVRVSRSPLTPVADASQSADLADAPHRLPSHAQVRLRLRRRILRRRFVIISPRYGSG